MAVAGLGFQCHRASASRSNAGPHGMSISARPSVASGRMKPGIDLLAPRVDHRVICTAFTAYVSCPTKSISAAAEAHGAVGRRCGRRPHARCRPSRGWTCFGAGAGVGRCAAMRWRPKRLCGEHDRRGSSWFVGPMVSQCQCAGAPAVARFAHFRPGLHWRPSSWPSRRVPLHRGRTVTAWSNSRRRS
jgi:hypothetical protein